MIIFVYGTLLGNAENHGIIRNAKLLTTGYIHGALYDLGVGYPAATVNGGGRVYGELYDVDDGLAPELDAFEGVDVHDPKGSLYERLELEVSTKDKGRIKAWVYAMKEDGLKKFFARPIPSGRWN